MSPHDTTIADSRSNGVVAVICKDQQFLVIKRGPDVIAPGKICFPGGETEAGEAVFGILYSPDVFDDLDPISVSGVQPNSLAAISEILNGYWWNGGTQPDPGREVVDPKRSRELERAGINRDLQKSGPQYPFLIGKTNDAGVVFDDPSSLYSTVGRALLSWLNDKMVQEKFINFHIGNWQLKAENHLMKPGTLVDVGAESEKGLAAFSSLGFSRLSIGTKYFEAYSVKRLVRYALDHLARFHSESPDADLERREAKDPDEIVRRLAKKQIKEGFLIRAGLDERGPKDDIINQLKPSAEEYQEANNRLRDSTAELMGLNRKKEQKTEVWLRKLRDALLETVPDFKSGK